MTMAGAACGRIVYELQNVYDRGNVGGFDFEIDAQEGTFLRRAEEWAGFLPSAGIRLDF